MTTSFTTRAPELTHARTAAYSLIAIGFQYPDHSLINMMANPQQWASWPEVLGCVDPNIVELLRSVENDARKEAVALLDHTDGEPRELQSRYDKLFGHAVRGQCPTYEMEYGRNEIIRQACDLADLAGFYNAFGLEFANGANGRPDHITAECEFMSTLCAKEAHALAQNDEENIDICINAQRTFLKDHLARWLPAFVHRIEEADGTSLYSTLARFADTFVKTECEHLDIHPGPPTLQLRPTDPVQDRTINCGPGDCGTSITGDQFVQLDIDHKNDQGK